MKPIQLLFSLLLLAAAWRAYCFARWSGMELALWGAGILAFAGVCRLYGALQPSAKPHGGGCCCRRG